jgi:iron complex transport system permease protein
MRYRYKLLLLALLPVVLGAIVLCIGRFYVPFDQVLQSIWSFITSPTGTAEEITVMKIRMPRIILAGMIGAALALAGTAFQSTLANPLASPDVIGVSSASAFGAAFAIFLGLSGFFLQFMALIMGLVSLVIVFMLCKFARSTSILTIVLAGIIIAGVFNALIALIKFVADPLTQLPDITYWLMGSIAGKGYDTVLSAIPLIGIASIIIFALRWRLNIISLDDEEVKAMGHNPQRLRWTFLISSTVLVATAVSLCGQIGWVGLVIPHMARLIVGSDNQRVVPVSMAIGAAFLIFCDTVCRSAIAAEIPLSICTALIGAPIFAYLFIRRRKAWL